MRVAAVQMESKRLSPEENTARVLAWMERAASMDVRLVVFPECVLTGYALSRQEAASNAESIPGSRTGRIQRACQETGLVVVVGTIERIDPARYFNAAVVLGPAGVLGLYRKTHLPGFGVDRLMTAGNTLGEPIDTPVGRCGVLICYDLYFPEPSRVLALNGSQLILLPSAWSKQSTYYPDFIARTRSAENGVYVIAADLVGREGALQYLGRSIIAGPNGQVLAEAGGSAEEIIVADVEPALSDRKERIYEAGVDEINLFSDRRPDLYGRVAN